MTRVIGVDACKKGWVGVTSDLRGYFGATIDQLVATADGDENWRWWLSTSRSAFR